MSFVIMLILVGAIIVSIVVYLSFLGRKMGIENEINSQLQLLNNYKTVKENAPTIEWINYLKKEKEELNSIYTKLMKTLDNNYTRMPKYAVEPLKFKEEIFDTQKDLRKLAYNKRLELKEEAVSLGFKEYETKIPTEEEVPNLTKRLEVIEKLVNLLTESKVQVLEKVEFLSVLDKTVETDNTIFSYRVFPVKLTLYTPARSLAKFLYKAAFSKYLFIAENPVLVSEAAGDELIRSEVIISAIVFIEEKPKDKQANAQADNKK